LIFAKVYLVALLKGTGRCRDLLGRASSGRLLKRGSEADPGRRIGVSGIPRFSGVMSLGAGAAGTGLAVVETALTGDLVLLLFLADMAGSYNIYQNKLMRKVSRKQDFENFSCFRTIKFFVKFRKKFLEKEYS
jgi:hypothetical protein